MQPPRISTPIRCWMTGAFAVVMAALGAGRLEAATDRQRMVCLSRYGVSQTVQRLEDTARRRGFGVFAKVRLQDVGSGFGRAEGLVLVLESSRGGTPVLMHGDGEALRSELPLRVEVHPHGRQSSRVWIPPTLDVALADLPAGLADDLAGLPALVADALG